MQRLISVLRLRSRLGEMGKGLSHSGKKFSGGTSRSSKTGGELPLPSLAVLLLRLVVATSTSSTAEPRTTVRADASAPPPTSRPLSQLARAAVLRARASSGEGAGGGSNSCEAVSCCISARVRSSGRGLGGSAAGKLSSDRQVLAAEDSGLSGGGECELVFVAVVAVRGGGGDGARAGDDVRGGGGGGGPLGRDRVGLLGLPF